MSRWAIYIDIQGFGYLWEKNHDGLQALIELMSAIYRIGNNCYINSPDRLFAHQFGDGFLIVSEFAEGTLERCMTIAIALLRHVAVTGCYAKAAIVEGEMQGINGCYPEEVMRNSNANCIVPMGDGLLTIVQVMGTALIRGVKLEKRSPKGPLLVIEKEKISRIPQGVSTSDAGEDIVSIDWINYQSDLLSDIQLRANLKSQSKSDIEASLLRYCDEHKALPEDWVKNVNKYLLAEKASK